ncbi:MAG: hypothetical protein JNK05_41525 [Myxococcales bacterium]|nr:hypothetical protein [Myxococcales bacterium]
MKVATVLRWSAATVIVVALTTARLAHRGIIALPGIDTHPGLEAQLRDRGTMAIAGRVPFGLRKGDVQIVDYHQFGPLAAALDGRDSNALAAAMRESRIDGLVVRTDTPQGPAGSVLRALSMYRPVPNVTATWMDRDAALYEVREQPVVSEQDAPKLIETVRLMMQGAAAPPERLFPEALRGARPAEVMVVVRDGTAPILWRAVRGGSVARALVDATYAIIDRWGTRQQNPYGPLSSAIRGEPEPGRSPPNLLLTVAIFYDKGTLETREPAWIDRAVDEHSFAVGYERLGRWEYNLPPPTGASTRRSAEALAQLVREHDVPPPGFQRTDLTLYRFRALQLIEQSRGGPVTVANP